MTEYRRPLSTRLSRRLPGDRVGARSVQRQLSSAALPCTCALAIFSPIPQRPLLLQPHEQAQPLPPSGRPNVSRLVWGRVHLGFANESWVTKSQTFSEVARLRKRHVITGSHDSILGDTALGIRLCIRQL